MGNLSKLGSNHKARMVKKVACSWFAFSLRFSVIPGASKATFSIANEDNGRFNGDSLDRVSPRAAILRKSGDSLWDPMK
jgi:hypothetical protein